MKNIAKVMLVLTLVMCTTACSSKDTKDTGVLMSVGDSGNDSSNNTQTAETNDGEKDTEVVTKEDKTENNTSEKDNIYGGFTSVDGDVFQFNKDNTFLGFIVKDGKEMNGTYETDGRTYVTLKYSDNTDDTENVKDNNDTKDDKQKDDNSAEVAYITKEKQDDGKLLVKEFDKDNNEIREYSTEDTEEQTSKDSTDTEKADNNKDTEMTYQLTKTNMEDDNGNTVLVIVLSKGDTEITLTKQYEVN